jgi:outer membrane immunogenic protein
MKKTTFMTAAFAIALSAPALAADLAVKAPVYKAPPPIPVFSWTGCYVGGNGGGLWQQKDFALSGVGVTVPGRAVAFPPVDFGSHDANSWVAGAQIGCNYQVAGTGWVFGIQADYDWTDASGSHLDPFGGFTTLRSHANSLGSVTGRVGYAWDRFLGYVKGGGAWERDDYDWLITGTGFAFASGSETRGGWTVGVGGEYAFTDWLTGFIEYDHYDFGTRTVGLSTVTPVFVNFDIKERKDVVKAGLNVRFGWGGPVYARY